MKVPGTHDFTITIVRVDPDSGEIIEIHYKHTGKILSKVKLSADRTLALLQRQWSKGAEFQAHLVRNDYWPDLSDSEPVGFATATPDGFAWDEWTKQ